MYLLETFLPDLTVLEDKAISHSLEDFSFSKGTATYDDDTFYLDNTRNELDDDDDDDNDGQAPELNMDTGDDPQPVEDFFVGDEAIAENYGGGMGDYGDDDHSNGSVSGGGPSGGYSMPFDPSRTDNRELTLAMTEEGGEVSELMDKLDKSVSKNWAGPEHWKIRKVIRRRSFILLINPDPNSPFQTLKQLRPMRTLPKLPRLVKIRKRRSRSIFLRLRSRI